jgi:hypothetical protein
VQGSDGSSGADLYSAGAARDWAATYRRWNPSPPPTDGPALQRTRHHCWLHQA